jgi:hypothetical protein
MDIRMYFQKMREVEHAISGVFAVVRSLETPDGGRAGMLTEVSRAIAAQLVVEGKARLATEEEAREYKERVDQSRAEAEQAAAASRMQFTILTEQEARVLRARQKS